MIPLTDDDSKKAMYCLHLSLLSNWPLGMYSCQAAMKSHETVVIEISLHGYIFYMEQFKHVELDKTYLGLWSTAFLKGQNIFRAMVHCFLEEH